MAKEDKCIQEIQQILGLQDQGYRQATSSHIQKIHEPVFLSHGSMHTSYQIGQKLAENDFELPETAIISAANFTQITEITSSEVFTSG